MFDRFSGGAKTITVGLALDAEADRCTLAIAKSFQDITGCSVRLTHAIEPWEGRAVISLYPGQFLPGGVIEQVEHNLREQAEEKLAKIAATFGDVAETKVLVGRPAEAIASDAVAASSAAVFCGAEGTSHRLVPSGFSTALSLMANCTVPLMVVPENTQIQFAKHQLRVLLADDLRDAGMNALELACDLGLEVPATDLFHLHICQHTEEELIDFGRDVLAALERKELPGPTTLGEETFLSQAREAIELELNRRMGFIKSLLKSGTGSYKQIVRFGPVLEQLRAACEDVAPDIIVFGRHELLHRNWSWGRMSYASMLELNRPLMIAPPRHS